MSTENPKNNTKRYFTVVLGTSVACYISYRALKYYFSSTNNKNQQQQKPEEDQFIETTSISLSIWKSITNFVSSNFLGTNNNNSNNYRNDASSKSKNKNNGNDDDDSCSNYEE